MNRYILVTHSINLIIITILSFVLFNLTTANDRKNLVMVQVVWRHGQRAPINGYPNDIYSEESWGIPYATLTKDGTLQQEELGKNLRKLYIESSGFISNKYNPDEVQIRSTKKNRTIESAYANLRGFYNIESSNDIPILTDFFGINGEWSKGKACPKLKELTDKRIQSIENKVYNDNKEFIDMLKEKSGLSEMSLFKISNLFDIFYSHKKLNKNLPEWMNDENYEKLKQLSFEIYRLIDGASAFGLEEDLEMTKLYEGPLLKTIIDNFDKKRCQNGISKFILKLLPQNDDRSTSSNLKYVAYSAHDYTISGLFFIMGINDFMGSERLEIDYTATLFFELYKNNKNQLEIKILFSNRKGENIFDITDTVIGCKGSKTCLYNDFKNGISERIPSNIKEECNYE